MLADHQSTLDQLRAGALDAHAFCAAWRSLPLPAALPPRFAQVRDQLLDRVESSALFSGESCSFSQADLAGALQQWLDKARERAG